MNDLKVLHCTRTKGRNNMKTTKTKAERGWIVDIKSSHFQWKCILKWKDHTPGEMPTGTNRFNDKSHSPCCETGIWS